MVQNDQSEPIIPDPKASIQHVAIDPKGHHMAAVNNKVANKNSVVRLPEDSLKDSLIPWHCKLQCILQWKILNVGYCSE